ncbi:hypothetical protein [Rhodococcus sp. NPDC060176]|uniref:hypothetical protein n=1 Tax=Rhodococcus sp. NPDC060176 TaxID=3347062 RepID=UPI003659A9C4
MKVIPGSQVYAESDGINQQVDAGFGDHGNGVTEPVTNSVTNTTLSLPIPSLPTTDVSPKARKRVVDSDEFVRFWAVYPRREDKGNARAAFAKALRIADVETIIAGAERYRDSPKRKPNYTRLPTTWLNGEGWEDELVGAAKPLPPGERMWEE